jgi:hypothetical protein
MAGREEGSFAPCGGIGKSEHPFSFSLNLTGKGLSGAVL